jgi:hypothetical protein
MAVIDLFVLGLAYPAHQTAAPYQAITPRTITSSRLPTDLNTQVHTFLVPALLPPCSSLAAFVKFAKQMRAANITMWMMRTTWQPSSTMKNELLFERIVKVHSECWRAMHDFKVMKRRTKPYDA